MSAPSDESAPESARTLTSEISAVSLTAGDIIADRYELRRLLGIGAMGEVFEAEDRHLDVRIALKVLRRDLAASETALGRFRQELLTARRVSHKNVVRLHDMFQSGERWLLSMDFVPGESLEKKLSREGALPVDVAVDICAQLAAGLAAAHDAGVVHRDLKPANILIDGDGRVRIADFGIARSLSQAGFTREGLVVGTPDYLSPEQAAAEPVDGRSDLYALGVVLCEMLTGRLPFNATTAQEAVSQRLARSPTPLVDRSDIPAWLVEVCHRLLRRQPARRYASAQAVLAELERAGASERTGTVRWALAVTALVAVALAGAWWTTSRDASGVAPGTAVKRPTSVAVLPVSGGEDGLSWALTDQIAAAGARHVGPSRLDAVSRLLDFDVASMHDHRQRLAGELGVGRLLIPEVKSDGIVLTLFDAEDAFTSPRAEYRRAGAADLRAADRAWLHATLGLHSAQPDATLIAIGPQAFHRGLIQLDQGNAMDALPTLRAAVAATPDHAGAWWAIAWALEANGLFDEAQDAALQAGSKARGDGRYARLAAASAAIATGDFTRADRLVEELVAGYPEDTLILGVAAEYAGDGGDFERADALLDRLTVRYPENGRAWFLRAKFAILRGESQLALDNYLIRARTLHSRLRNRQGQADTINAQGIAYEQLGQLDEARRAYSEAAELRRAVGDRRGEAATLRNLAAIEAIRGDPAAADEQLAAARALLQGLGDLEGMADLYNDAGVLAEERGQYETAYDRYREALDIRRQLPNERSVAESLGNVGFVSIELGSFARARAYLDQAAVLFEQVGDRAGQVHVQQNLALLDVALGRLDEAAARIAEVDPVTRSLQMSQERAVNEVISAEIDLARGAFASAIEGATAAETAFAALDDRRGVTEAALLRVRTLLALGQPAEADSLLAALAGQSDNAVQAIEIAILLARTRLLEGDSDGAKAALTSTAPGGAVALALEMELLRLRADDADPEEWQELLDSIRALDHRELMVETALLAGRAGARAGDRDRARGLLEAHWPLVRDGSSRHRVGLALLGENLCPAAALSCAQWQDEADQAREAALQQAPDALRQAFAATLDHP